MNPHQRNKIDINALSPEEQRLFRMYGKLPNKTDLLQNKLKERKYFDSGDYALSKAGKASDAGVTQIGREHPSPENIPHSSSNLGHGHNGSISGSISGAVGLPPPAQGSGSISGQSGSPVKEGGSYLHRETSADDFDGEEEDDKIEREDARDDDGTGGVSSGGDATGGGSGAKPIMISKS